MAVTDPTALRFSNQRIRVAADRLAKCYYACKAVKDRWDGLGGGQPAIDIMEGDIRAAADRIIDAYGFCFDSEKLWFLLGGTGLIPNDAGESIEDGSPGDGRPAVNGQDAVRVIDRIVQLQNWLLSAAGGFDDATRANTAYINTVYAVTNEGSVTMSIADAGNFINRCGELLTNYEATSQQNLDFILAYAVNPNL